MGVIERLGHRIKMNSSGLAVLGWLTQISLEILVKVVRKYDTNKAAYRSPGGMSGVR